MVDSDFNGSVRTTLYVTIVDIYCMGLTGSLHVLYKLANNESCNYFCDSLKPAIMVSFACLNRSRRVYVAMESITVDIMCQM